MGSPTTAIRSMKWVGDFSRVESTTWSWGPRLSREPNDQLDAPNRRLPESRVRRFAKRKLASHPTSIFLVNSFLFPLHRSSELAPVGSEAWFWCVTGTIVGTVSARAGYQDYRSDSTTKAPFSLFMSQIRDFQFHTSQTGNARSLTTAASFAMVVRGLAQCRPVSHGFDARSRSTSTGKHRSRASAASSRSGRPLTCGAATADGFASVMLTVGSAVARVVASGQLFLTGRSGSTLDCPSASPRTHRASPP